MGESLVRYGAVLNRRSGSVRGAGRGAQARRRLVSITACAGTPVTERARLQALTSPTNT